MAEALRARVAAIWDSLARRNTWQLLDNPAPLLDEVTAALAPETASDEAIRIALYRAYSRQLYSALRSQEERAAQELWLACVRRATRSGLDQAQAAAVAQEAVTRLLARLETLRDPAAVITYTFYVLRTILREQRLIDEKSLDEALAAGTLEEPADLGGTAESVERNVLDQQILRLLQAKLPNLLERIVFIRHVLFGDKPRDIARDLALPLARARLAKHRAVQRLRADAEFMQFCHQLRTENGS